MLMLMLYVLAYVASLIGIAVMAHQGVTGLQATHPELVTPVVSLVMASFFLSYLMTWGSRDKQ